MRNEDDSKKQTKRWNFQDTWEPPRRQYNADEEDEEEDDDEIEDEVDRDVEDGGDNTWGKDPEEGNEVSPGDGLQDLQYFPNFYRLLRSLDSGKNSGSLTCFFVVSHNAFWKI